MKFPYLSSRTHVVFGSRRGRRGVSEAAGGQDRVDDGVEGGTGSHRREKKKAATDMPWMMNITGNLGVFTCFHGLFKFIYLRYILAWTDSFDHALCDASMIQANMT